jgi:GDP-L-fucose synthase
MKKNIKLNWINIGTGIDYKIKDIAKIVMSILDVKAEIFFDKSKLDGTPRKVLNIKNARKYGWKPKFTIKSGILKTYEDFIKKN